MQGIFSTHNPTCSDIQALLTTLLMAEEKSAAFTKAREEANKEYDPKSGSRRPSEEAVPGTNPEWDPNSL